MHDASGREPRRIIITEESLDVRYKTAAMLRDDGYDVTAVGDGADLLVTIARAELNGRPPTLVVWNVQRAGADVLPVLARIRRRQPGLPIILLVAVASERALDEVYRAGGTVVLVSSVDPQDLREVVRSYADLGAQPQGSE